MKSEVADLKRVSKDVAAESSKQSLDRKARLLTGWRVLYLRARMRLRLIRLIVSSYRNPIDWIGALHYLIQLRKNYLGSYGIKKLLRRKGKFYMGIYSPAWFSHDFDKLIYTQLNDFKPIKRPFNRFDLVFLSVTDSCPLRCEHCYNWQQTNLDGNKDLKAVIHKLQESGVSHIQFTGGEPLLESQKICDAVRSAFPGTEFWMSTSGFSLSPDKAGELKSAGLRGVIISLDHYDPSKHNEFRNHSKSFEWVQTAINNALDAGLMVALSICITRDFIDNSSLHEYMKLAKEQGVMFVQFLEPKAVGHYQGKDVLLSEPQIREVETFFLSYNFTDTYSDFPIIMYPGYHQRRMGCRFSGRRSIYIDAEGIVNPCPFCHRSFGKVLDKDYESNLEKLVAEGCPDYN